MTSRGFILGIVVAAMGNFGCKSELAMPGGVNIIGGGTTLTPLTNAASASDIRSGKKVYDSDGNVITGILATQSLEPNSTAVPAGYYSVTSLDSVDSDLVSSNIKSGVTIFGVTGTSAAGDFISSMAPRKDNATVDLSNVAVLNRSVATISQEASGAATFTNNHNLVPDPRYDNDGRYVVTGGSSEKRHYLETVLGRPTASCGTSGELEARISDCFTANLLSGSTTISKAFYDGQKYGQNGEGDWRLVTLTSGGKEVWRDERTKLLWSDSSNSSYNWCQAAGFAFSSDTTSFMNFQCSAGQTGGLQETPKSVCAEAGLLSSATFSINDEQVAKGGLGYSTTPSVAWRLPTVHDWITAEINGVRKVLPRMSTTTPTTLLFWSATSRTSASGDSRIGSAWFFNANSGQVNFSSLSTSYSVRCVGR